MIERRTFAIVLLLAATASLSVPRTLFGLQEQATVPRPAAVRAAPERHLAAIDAGRALLDSLRLAGGIPGLSVAVGIGGDIVWSEGFGFADLENRVAVTPLTKFRIGSVSKSVSSISVGQLVAEGRLDLDLPVQTYVPGFPEKPWPITTRLVAGHLAGIRHYRGAEFESARHYATVAQGLTIFADDPLLFEPGTRWSYSSYGWNLVSAVVEGAAGEPFLAFVDNSNKWAGGGFLSTPAELLELAFALLDGELLERETLELLWTPQRTRDGEATEYGIGWYVSQDAAGRRMVGHGGGSVGGTTLFWIWPEREVVVVLTANLSEAPLGGRAFAERLGVPFLDAEP